MKSFLVKSITLLKPDTYYLSALHSPIDFAVLNLVFYQINLFGMKLQRETLFYKK